MDEIRPLGRPWLFFVLLATMAALAYSALAMRHRAPPRPSPATLVATTPSPAAASHSSRAVEDRDNALGGLVGTHLGENYGVVGLGLVDNRKSEGQGTIGLGHLVQEPLHVCLTNHPDDEEDCVPFADLERAVRGQQREARRCLDRAHHEHPRLRGRIEIDFTVDADGSTSKSEAHPDLPYGEEPEPALYALGDCLESAVRRWKIGPERLRSSEMTYWYRLR